MRPAIVASLLAVMICIPILVALTPPVSAATSTLSIGPKATGTASIGAISKGKVVEYGWGTDSAADNLDFYVNSGGTKYGAKTGVNGSLGSISVQSDMTFTMNWTCNNDYNTAFVHYWFYTVSLKVDFSFDRNLCAPNETDELTVTITNTNSDQITVAGVGIHFDWYDKDVYEVDQGLEATPVTVGAGSAMTSYVQFNTNGAAEGFHLYDIIVRYDLKHDDQWTRYDWTSGSQFNFKISTQDSDGDGYPDSSDRFPSDPTQHSDADKDGYGDNQSGNDPDAFPLDPKDWVDTDGDGVGDNSDKFPSDPAASMDTDGDGHPDAWNAGKSADDSNTGLELDHYPNDKSKWEKKDDSPGFGVLGAVLAIALAMAGIVLVGIIARKKK